MIALAINRVAPVYPLRALVDRVQGTVVCVVRVDVDGTVVDVDIHSGPAQLRSAAQLAVCQWRFRPMHMAGEARKYMGAIVVTMRLPGLRSPSRANNAAPPN
jgi:TonB family protein